MKKKSFTLLAVVFATLLLVFASVIAMSMSESTPSVSIEKFNLTFESDTYIKYAVKFSGVSESDITRGNTGMLYWTAPQESYEIGSESASSEIIGYTTIDGEKYYTFAYDKFSAKQMTDYVYSVAYIVIDGEYYYSDVAKYSILTYAYDILGYTGEASDNASLKNMLLKLLDYGAAAQECFGYKTDRLANAKYYQVAVEGGCLSDGSTHGLYLAGDSVLLIAPETDAEGTPFAYWADKTGSSVATSSSATLVVKAENNIYTPVYGEGVKYSEGLEFDTNDDGTCILLGRGDCTDTDIVVPPTALDGDIVVEIDRNAFSGDTAITSISLPSTIESIGRHAFSGCSSLTDVYFDGTEDEWNEGVDIASGNNPLLNATMHFKTAPLPPAPEYTEPTIVISSANASAGATNVEITVALKSNPGIASLNLLVTYEDGLTLTDIEYNSAIGGMSQQPQKYSSPVILNWFNGVADSEGDWVFATLTFDVSVTADAGDYEISLTYNPNNVYDITETNVHFEVVNGVIAIK